MDDFVTKPEFAAVRDDIRAIGVIVERTDANVRLLAEALVATRDELKRDVADLRTEMTVRFETVESAVRQNSVDIQQLQRGTTEIRGDITAIRGDTTAIRGDITAIRGDITAIRGDITAIRGDIGELKKKH